MFIKLASLLLISFAMAEFSLNFESFSNNSTYLSSVGANLSVAGNYGDTTLFAERRQTPIQQNDRYGLSHEYFVSDRVYYFGLLTLDSGINRYGAGIGYVITDGQKISIASVVDSSKGSIVSIRYKIKGKVDALDYRLITFVLGYTYNLDYEVGYSISKHLTLVYSGFYDDLSKTNWSGLGCKVIL